MDDIRLDLLVMKQAGFSREYSREVIENGLVYVNGEPRTKPGAKFNINACINIIAPRMRYVGRGGYKLEKALDVFGIRLDSLTCGDIGASTGGFTDCMLQYGAKKVYAIDVGSSQLAESLREDMRVISIENQNIRELPSLPEMLDFAAVDVSFISIMKVIDNVIALLKDDGFMVCLIKPQFEVGNISKNGLNKKGVVKDKRVYEKILNMVSQNFISKGISILSVIESPLKGGDGNTEYLLYAGKGRLK